MPRGLGITFIVHLYLHFCLVVSFFLFLFFPHVAQRSKTSPPNKCPGYDIEQSNGEAPAILSTPSLPSFPGPLWPGVVVLSMGQIEL